MTSERVYLATANAEGEVELPPSVVSGSAEAEAQGLAPKSAGASSNVIEWVPERLNVQAFGAIPGTNCSTAVIAAITAAKAANLVAFELYFPSSPSSYKLALGKIGEAVSGKGISLKLSGDGTRGSWIAPIDNETPILTIEGAPEATNEGFSMVDIGVVLPSHREYGKPLIQLNFTRMYHVERVTINGENHTGTIFSHESSYDGSWRDVTCLEGEYMLPFVHTNELAWEAAYQQCDNFLFDRCDFNVNGPVFRNCQDEVHSVIGISIKCVASSYYPEGCKLLTTLAKEAKAGATSCELTSVTHLEIGHQLRVGHDANGNSSDYLRVTAISGNEVTFAATTPLRFTHAAGAPAQMGGVALTLGDSVNSCTLIRPHFERQNIGVALGNGSEHNILGLYSAVNYSIMYCGPKSKNVRVIGATMGGGTLANALYTKASDNTAGEIGGFSFTGPVRTITGSIFGAEVGGSSSAYYDEEYADTNGGIVARRNNGESANAAKDRAWEATQANSTTAKIQYGGRGYFKDSVAYGDLGSITGKTSAEIDALLKISPSDSTSVGVIVATAELSGKRVVLARKTGSGNKWQVSAAMTQIE